jgi:hypothetical protein
LSGLEFKGYPPPAGSGLKDVEHQVPKGYLFNEIIASFHPLGYSGYSGFQSISSLVSTVYNTLALNPEP